MQPQMVMYDEEFQQISGVCERLAREANAKIVFLVDKNGQLIASVGATENLDTTSLASLTAGNIAATGRLAKLIGEKEFSILFHEGEKDNLHISIIGGRVILVVIFDTRSSLGLVRLRVKKASDELNNFFDFLPLSLGEIRGFKTRFHLYTVPGQVFYDASRKLILKGVDGVVFVADSQIERMEANIESLDNLRMNLEEQGYNLDKIPYVVQYNKRDLPNSAPMDELKKVLNPTNVPEFEAVAPKGEGVYETLKAIARLILTELKKGT